MTDAHVSTSAKPFRWKPSCGVAAHRPIYREAASFMIAEMERRHHLHRGALINRRSRARSAPDVSHARMIAMHLMHSILDNRRITIARHFGFDHTSIWYGLSRMAADIEAGPAFRAEIVLLEAEMRAALTAAGIRHPGCETVNGCRLVPRRTGLSSNHQNGDAHVCVD